MPRKKGSPARKRPSKNKAKVPPEDNAAQDSHAEVTVQAELHAPPASAAVPDPEPEISGPVLHGEDGDPVDDATSEAPMGTEEVSPTVHEEGEVRPPTPPNTAHDDEQVQLSKDRGKGKGKGKAVPKKDWSLNPAIEEDILEWLKGNSYLWLRSRKGYKQKRTAWEMKAQELGIDVEHLELWWKGIKDWYVKLSKKTSGQATRMLTERETWVLQHCGFYKGSIPSDTGDPLVTLSRVPSASATASHPPLSVDSDGECQAHVLEDMESAAFDQASTSHSTSSRSRKRDKRRRDEEEEEDTWMRDLRATMQANQALPEKLVEERPRSDREPFVRFVAETLRTAPQEKYDEMKELIFDILRHSQHGNCEQPFRSCTRAAQDVSTLPENTASQPSPQLYGQPTSCQQNFHQHNPQFQQNWQYGSSFIQQTAFPTMRHTTPTPCNTPMQFRKHHHTFPHQQQQSVPSCPQPRESAESWSRLLTQDTMQGDVWNTNLSLDNTMLPSTARSSLPLQASINTSHVSGTSLLRQTRPQEQLQEQQSQEQ